MKHKSFREISELLAGCETYADAYAEFLQTEDVPPRGHIPLATASTTTEHC